jgi:hypothetical protein
MSLVLPAAMRSQIDGEDMRQRRPMPTAYRRARYKDSDGFIVDKFTYREDVPQPVSYAAGGYPVEGEDTVKRAVRSVVEQGWQRHTSVLRSAPNYLVQGQHASHILSQYTDGAVISTLTKVVDPMTGDITVVEGEITTCFEQEHLNTESPAQLKLYTGPVPAEWEYLGVVKGALYEWDSFLNRLTDEVIHAYGDKVVHTYKLKHAKAMDIEFVPRKVYELAKALGRVS